MMHLKRRPFLFLLFAFTVCSCTVINTKPRHEFRYYSLEYPSPQFSGIKPLPLVIKIDPFNAAPSLNTANMVYRDQSFKIKTYPYHKWRAWPSELVHYFLLRDLKASGLFRAVLSYSSRSAAPYVLEGSVDEFLERDQAGTWEAVLSLSITLIRPAEKDGSKRIVLQKEYHRVENCKRKNPLGVAEAMSHAMAGISEQITRDLYTHLETQ